MAERGEVQGASGMLHHYTVILEHALRPIQITKAATLNPLPETLQTLPDLGSFKSFPSGGTPWCRAPNPVSQGSESPCTDQDNASSYANPTAQIPKTPNPQ